MSGRFAVSPTPLPGVHLVRRKRQEDSRGFLSRLFCAEELAGLGWVKPVAQINHTYTSSAGTVRGLHFQRPPHCEMKLVTCLRGQIFDVAVDLRANSPTFLQWHGEILSADNGDALLLPEGCAHGFQSLVDGVEMLYLHSAPYTPEADCGVSPMDGRLAIRWPLPVSQMSNRDAGHPTLDDNFHGLQP